MKWGGALFLIKSPFKKMPYSVDLFLRQGCSIRTVKEVICRIGADLYHKLFVPSESKERLRSTFDSLMILSMTDQDWPGLR